MLGKLFRHEFRACGRVFLALYAAFIVITLVNKIFWVVDADNMVTDMIRGFVTFLYAVSAAAVVIMTFVLIVYRFYNNLLKDEGYLSFTLPVTVSQHIIAKLIVSFLFIVFSFIVMIASILIMAAEAGFMDMFREFVEQLRLLFTLYSGSLRFVIELGVLAVVAAVYLILMLYASLSLGQLFTKHKLGGAVLGFVGFYIVAQIIASIIMAILFFNNRSYFEMADSMDAADMYRAFDMLNGLFLVIIGLELVLGIVYYLLTRFILSKKLNLE